MSFIDTRPHEMCGMLAGLPVYHPLAAYTDALCWGDVPRADPVCARGQMYRAMRLGSWSSRGGSARTAVTGGLFASGRWVSMSSRYAARCPSG